MRLVTFRGPEAAAPAVGCLVKDDLEIVDLTSSFASDPSFRSMQALIEAGPVALDAAREVVDRAQRIGGPLVPRTSVQLLAPVPRPIQMRDFGCFSEHALNCQKVRLKRRAAASADPAAAYETLLASNPPTLPKDYMERPRFYTCNRLSVVGDATEIPWPSLTTRLDFELEFGVFIGSSAKDVGEADAHRHIFGYTIFNDLTMRDVQAAEERTGGKNKDFDCGNVMGPCIVTADELRNPYELRAIARVNGEIWCDNNTSTMDRSFEQIIAYMSQSQTLHPGEFLGSGTVGQGCGFERDEYLNPGDTVELEVEKIGKLSITIGQKKDRT